MSKKHAGKTNAMRALDAAGVTYAIGEYDTEITSAEGAAAALGVPPAEVYKTLVMLRDENVPILVMVPGGREVVPKVLAQALGARSVAMAPKAQAERLTGLQTGGIGALALLDKHFAVYIDRDALELNRIYVNAGRRGLNVRVPVDSLIRLTGAVPVEVTRVHDQPC